MSKSVILILLLLTTSCSTQKVITEKSLEYAFLEFGEFIWLKNKKDSIVFNEKNLDIIRLKKGKYHRALGRYTSRLINNSTIIEHLTFSEKSKIVAHLVYYLGTIDDFSLLDSVIYEDYDHDLNYYNEFEKNNYYNLPNFKDQYRETFQKLKPPKKLEVIKPILKIEKQD